MCTGSTLESTGAHQSQPEPTMCTTVEAPSVQTQLSPPWHVACVIACVKHFSVGTSAPRHGHGHGKPPPAAAHHKPRHAALLLLVFVPGLQLQPQLAQAFNLNKPGLHG